MIRIENLSKHFGSRAIIDEQTLHFPQGERIAIVGPNGAGKTTLLNILCGLDAPDGGLVKTPPCRLGYLPQEPNTQPKATIVEECESARSDLLALKTKMSEALERMEDHHDHETLHAFEHAESAYRLAGGYELRSKAEKILVGLGFSATRFILNPRQLSGGWRMRIELAKLFLVEPDVLILDEPTNHLDLPSLLWVERFLQSYRGTLLFVSHDRSLLNRLATYTVRIASGTLKLYTGNYDAYVTQEAKEYSIAENTSKNLEKQIQDLQTFVDRFGAKATKAAQAQSKRKLIAKLEEEKALLPQRTRIQQMKFKLPDPLPCERMVCQVQNGAIGYKETLCKGIDFSLEKGQKVALIGANGIGKSTLLKTIVGVIEKKGGTISLAPRASIAYFAQDQLLILDPHASVLENLLAQSPVGENEARKILGGFLFSKDDVFKPLRVLSGGEKNRVGLACILAKKANFLLLDEPTNHLDMLSIDCLTQALVDYNGTLLFVSHDRAFINSICTHTFVMTEKGESMMFEGNVDDYERLAEIAGFPNVLQTEKLPSSPVSETSPSDYHDAKKQEKELRLLLKKKDKVEAELLQSQKELDLCEQEFLKVFQDHQAIRELGIKKEKLSRTIEALENEWLSLTERIENLRGK
ncbi:MAG: ABC-F family ATP-binding cassette domain-containing protein [Deltaproteobacteria bacterium]|nr:ABC-F family ATP-binding cassette domain-containing protein [Deltaproteobacteria bacterium]